MTQQDIRGSPTNVDQKRNKLDCILSLQVPYLLYISISSIAEEKKACQWILFVPSIPRTKSSQASIFAAKEAARGRSTLSISFKVLEEKPKERKEKTWEEEGK